VVVEDTLKMCSKSLCNLTGLAQNGFHQSQVKWNFCRFLLKKDIFPKIHPICLEVIIDIFKPDEFITLNGCSDKLTI
jgi:hypothetical protein